MSGNRGLLPDLRLQSDYYARGRVLQGRVETIILLVEFLLINLIGELVVVKMTDSQTPVLSMGVWRDPMLPWVEWFCSFLTIILPKQSRYSDRWFPFCQHFYSTMGSTRILFAPNSKLTRFTNPSSSSIVLILFWTKYNSLSFFKCLTPLICLILL